jgi:hypothetical protein
MVVLLLVALAAGCATRGEPRPGASADGDRPATTTGTAAANVWYVPGRAVTCGGAAILAGVVMTITFGNAYESASELMHGGCSGPWVLRADDVY